MTEPEVKRRPGRPRKPRTEESIGISTKKKDVLVSKKPTDYASKYANDPAMRQARAVFIDDKKVELKAEHTLPVLDNKKPVVFDEEAYKVGLLMKEWMKSSYRMVLSSALLRVKLRKDGSYSVEEP